MQCCVTLCASANYIYGVRMYPVLLSDSPVSLKSYLLEIKKYPLLTQSEEAELITKMREEGDVESAHRLVTSHLRLVVKIAMQAKNYGIALYDLISEGNIGLMQAVKKFDPSAGARLATYAVWWIQAAINEYVIKSWSLVRIGTTAVQKKLFYKLQTVKRKILSAHNQLSLSDSDIGEIAEELSVKESDIKEMDLRLLGDKSLDYTLSTASSRSNSAGNSDHSGGSNSSSSNNAEGASSLLDMIGADVDVEGEVSESQEISRQKQIFKKALAHLSDRERDIVVSRNIYEDSATTLSSLSSKYNVSRERIRQLEIGAIEKLKAHCLKEQKI